MSAEGTTPRRYDASFSETVTLTDGSQAVIRTVHPDDKELLRRGFDQLSPESRYLRFFSTKIRLTERELEYLTNVDGEIHFAIGASRIGEDGVEEGLGIGRFIRDADNPEAAEPALAVIDHAQGLGLGTILLNHLTEAARERGVRVFHCDLLAQNDAMTRLLEEISPDLELRNAGNGIVEATVPLVPVDPAAPTEESRENPSYRLLAFAARRAGTVKLGRRLLSYLGYEADDAESPEAPEDQHEDG